MIIGFIIYQLIKRGKNRKKIEDVKFHDSEHKPIY